MILLLLISTTPLSLLLKWELLVKQWWVVLVKVAFDQTVWSAIWNTIYFLVLGLLRFDSLDNIYDKYLIHPCDYLSFENGCLTS